MSDRFQGVETTSATSQIPDPCNPFELREELDESRTALLALSELLKSASLSYFDSEQYLRGSIGYQRANNAQRGLSRLIDLCIDSQARIIDSYVDQYQESDAYLLKSAEAIVYMAQRGAYENSDNDHLTEALSNTSTVLQRNGDLHNKVRAKDLETIISDLMKKRQPAHSATPKGKGVAA